MTLSIRIARATMVSMTGLLAFGLLVLYHVGMYYVTWDWQVKSPIASDGLEPFMLMS